MCDMRLTNGLQSYCDRQFLFELKDLNLQKTYTTAIPLETTHKHADSYLEHGPRHRQVAAHPPKQDNPDDSGTTVKDESPKTVAENQKFIFQRFQLSLPEQILGRRLCLQQLVRN